MNKILLTGATTFLGYHVVKRLNQLGIRPRVLELPGSNAGPLATVDVERCAGDLSDSGAVGAACNGVDTLLHTAFKVGASAVDRPARGDERINVAGTGRLLDTAAASGVSRAVVTGSALAVGVNRRPQPLTETADWSEHAFDFPYAVMRREGRRRRRCPPSRPGFPIVSLWRLVFTLGPDDPVGAPANKR